MTRRVIDLQPITVTLLAYRGDPFAFRVVFTDDPGEDTSDWVWRATVVTGTQRLDWEWEPLADGARLWLRGDQTYRLPANERTGFPFDVTCRPPEAGEGVTVIRGRMMVAERVTDPLRSDEPVGAVA